jgi:ribosome-associated translation inhibitor RaiA
MPPRMRAPRPLLIQINTDATLTSHAARRERINGLVLNAVERFSERISRVEVHLSVEHSNHPAEQNVRCLMEARVQGHSPVAVTHRSSSVDDAVEGAGEKLRHALEHTFGRADHQRDASARRHPPMP